jgi:hypothetical protein
LPSPSKKKRRPPPEAGVRQRKKFLIQPEKGFSKAAASALGLNPDTDILLLGMGEQTNRFAAVQAGSADGMTVDPGLKRNAVKNGAFDLVI